MGSVGDASPGNKYRIGVDVGGTNTDAVLISLSPTGVIASYKAPTTTDVTTGITEAIRAILQASSVPLYAIDCVIIGTTHFVNAVVQRSSALRRVGVIRLCGGSKDGYGLGVPPFVDYPEDLRELTRGRTFFCQGGHQITGAEISALDETELKHVAKQLVDDEITDIVVAATYSPLSQEHEVRAEEILIGEIEKLFKARGSPLRPRVTTSHKISSIGFLARENAAILNASLRPLAERTIFGFQKAMREIFQGLPCVLYLTQNDGSVLNAADALTLPIRTFNSGPTNSIRGGKFLWDVARSGNGPIPDSYQDPLVVIDIGGTTSDGGLLLPTGLPRMSSLLSSVGGVRTNFALPAVESIGLGGGSMVRVAGDHVTVGPDSVALELRQRSRVFGGDVLTTTDIMAAWEMRTQMKTSALSCVGDASNLDDVPIDVIQKAQVVIRCMIEELVDRTKISKGDVDVLIVGGGALLIDTDEPLSGVRNARRVRGGEVANAVGAAISRVSGVVDTVVDISSQTLRVAQDTVAEMAIDAAVKNGAQRQTVEIAEVTLLPLQYVDAKARIVVRAVGMLDAVKSRGMTDTDAEMLSTQSIEENKPTTNEMATSCDEDKGLSPATYRPRIEDGQWVISLTDLEWISSGCKVLGCGGGGDPYENYLKVKTMLEKAPGSVRVISAASLSYKATVGWTGCLGSPEVSSERLEADECRKAHDKLIRVEGLPPVDAFMAQEIGGGNGVVNLEVAAAHDVPCVDGDYMGRAYPTNWQTTPNVYGTSKGEALLPATIASGDGSFMTLSATRTDRQVDSILRAATVAMGCRAGLASAPKSARQVQEQGVLNTVSLAWWIGRALAMEKTVADKTQRIIEAVGGEQSAKMLAQGKITSVERVLKAGHSYGLVMIEGTLADGTRATVEIPFKNENAYSKPAESESEGMRRWFWLVCRT